MRISENTSLGELKNDPYMASLVPYLLYNRAGDGAGRLTDDGVTLLDLQKRDPVWQADSMADGLNAYLENAVKGKQLIFDVYDAPARESETERKDVKLFFFPAADLLQGERKTVVLAAGGAYGSVCSLPESFPAAAELSKKGVDVFALNYRVADGKTLFPRPMEDLRAAVRYLFKNSGALGIDMTHYAVGGFSAGAHLAACFGTEALGYISACLPKPELMILAYPLINVWKTTEIMPAPIRSMMRNGYLGPGAQQADARIYNVDECVFPGYPAVYMIQSLDDPTVPLRNTELMEKALKSHGIPCCRETAADGGHGWGTGAHTPAEGWINRMLDFWDKLQRGDAK